MTQNLFRISNENDAWKLLELWLGGESRINLEFNDWPRQRITIKGDDYHSSLRSGQMESLIAFQASVGRAYSAIAHGAYDMRRLRKDEEEQLQFTTKIEEGSSITDTDLTPLVNSVAQLAQTHPVESLVAAVVIGLAIVSRSMILKHFDNKSKQMDMEERSKLVDLLSKITEDDRRKWDVFDSAISQLTDRYPAIGMMVPDVSSAYWRLASSSVGADSVEIEKVKLTGEDLEILAGRRVQRDHETSEVTDIFSVEGVSKIGANYRIQLKSETFLLSAFYGKPELRTKKVKQLLACLATSEKINANVQIKKVDKTQVVGRLLEFEVVPNPTEE